jgi:hypothetical protein
LLPGKLDLAWRQGSTFDRSLSLFDSDDQPMDLTGYTVSMEVRKSTTSRGYILKTDNMDGDGAITASTNNIDIFIHSQRTASIPAGRYVWEMRIIDPDSVSYTILAGNVVVYSGMV